MNKSTLITLLIINVLLIAIAGMKLATVEAWFEATLILISLVIHIIIADKLDIG